MKSGYYQSTRGFIPQYDDPHLKDWFNPWEIGHTIMHHADEVPDIPYIQVTDDLSVCACV